MGDFYSGEGSLIKARLEELGMVLWVDASGVVHGRSRSGDIPLEAWNLIDRLGMYNEQVAALILNDPRGIRRVDGLKVREVLRLKADGLVEVELCVVDKKAGLCEVFYRGGRG